MRSLFVVRALSFVCLCVDFQHFFFVCQFAVSNFDKHINSLRKSKRKNRSFPLMICPRDDVFLQLFWPRRFWFECYLRMREIDLRQTITICRLLSIDFQFVEGETNEIRRYGKLFVFLSCFQRFRTL